MLEVKSLVVEVELDVNSSVNWLRRRSRREVEALVEECGFLWKLSARRPKQHSKPK
jgi:hypothetical protein